MKFCTQCERAMRPEYSSGSVVYVCECGERREGSDRDARVVDGNTGPGEVSDKYAYLLSTAARDPTTILVERECPSCRRAHMAQVRIGPEENVVHVCKCGHTE